MFPPDSVPDSQPQAGNGPAPTDAQTPYLDFKPSQARLQYLEPTAGERPPEESESIRRVWFSGCPDQDCDPSALICSTPSQVHAAHLMIHIRGGLWECASTLDDLFPLERPWRRIWEPEKKAARATRVLSELVSPYELDLLSFIAVGVLAGISLAAVNHEWTRAIELVLAQDGFFDRSVTETFHASFLRNIGIVALERVQVGEGHQPDGGRTA